MTSLTDSYHGHPAPAAPERERFSVLDKDQLPFFLFLTVASGILFPLSYLNVNYEALMLLTFALLGAWQMVRGRLSIPPLAIVVGLILLAANAPQLVKLLTTTDTVTDRQVYRSLYGQIVFLAALVVFHKGFGAPDRMLRTANFVMRILSVLVLASALTGVRFFATGFMADTSSGVEDVANYRFITYYNSVIYFLLFYNVARVIDVSDRSSWIDAGIAAVLVILTGSRSLIAPAVAVVAIQLVVSGKFGRAGLAAGLMLMVGAAFAFFAGTYTTAVLARFNVDSFVDGWRATEQMLAWRAFSDVPVFGLPLGVPYTHVMSVLSGIDPDGYARNADYDMHNEYLWFLTYYGILGAMVVAAAVIVAVTHAARAAKGTPQGKAIVFYLLASLGPMFYACLLIRNVGGLWLGMFVAICLSGHAALQNGQEQR